jgi:hypothetical protein
MNSPLALLLVAGGGFCALLGVWYVAVDPRESDEPPRAALRLFGVACLLIACQEYFALGVYKAVDPTAYLRAVRSHTVFAFAAPVAIIWFVGLYTGNGQRWLLWIYTGVASTLIAVNLTTPATIHFSYVLEVTGVVLPWGERVAQATALPSKWPPVGDYLTGLFCALSLYGLFVGSEDRPHLSRTPLEAAFAILIATMVVELLDTRRVAALPVDEFGLMAFAIVLGFGLGRTPRTTSALSSNESSATPTEPSSRSEPP